jgi:hypothetical protein
VLTCSVFPLDDNGKSSADKLKASPTTWPGAWLAVDRTISATPEFVAQMRGLIAKKMSIGCAVANRLAAQAVANRLSSTLSSFNLLAGRVLFVMMAHSKQAQSWLVHRYKMWRNRVVEEMSAHYYTLKTFHLKAQPTLVDSPHVAVRVPPTS